MNDNFEQEDQHAEEQELASFESIQRLKMHVSVDSSLLSEILHEQIKHDSENKNSNDHDLNSSSTHSENEGKYRLKVFQEIDNKRCPCIEIIPVQRDEFWSASKPSEKD